MAMARLTWSISPASHRRFRLFLLLPLRLSTSHWIQALFSETPAMDTNEQVWIEEPGYPGARQALMMAGAKLVPVPVDHDGLDIAEGIRRARSAHAVYITPSHQYPLGVTMTASRRMLLLHWAMRTGAWIIEDDYDSEYRLGGRPIASPVSRRTIERIAALASSVVASI